MGRIADARARLARVVSEKTQARVQPVMSRRGPGEPEKRWKAAEREADYAKRDTKKMRGEVEGLRKRADATGWGVKKEQALRRAKDDAGRRTQVRVHPLLRT